jgi:putative effector of murein hydrolase
LLKYLKSASDDPLFTRIVLAIWAVPFIAVSVYSAFHLADISPADYWLVVIPFVAGTLGAFLLYTAILADNETVERRADLIGGGGEIIAFFAIIAVIILAVPIYELLKLLRSEQ